MELGQRELGLDQRGLDQLEELGRLVQDQQEGKLDQRELGQLRQDRGSVGESVGVGGSTTGSAGVAGSMGVEN